MGNFGNRTVGADQEKLGAIDAAQRQVFTEFLPGFCPEQATEVGGADE